MVTTQEIKRRLWDGANELRGSMDASRYKDYMLGLMFYKFLSDKTLDLFRSNAGLEGLSETEVVKEYKKAKKTFGEDVEKMIQQTLGYYVAPEYLYQSWLIDINEGKFELQKVTDSLTQFERTVAVAEGKDEFIGLFANTNIDLTDTALGSNLNDRSNNIKALILLFADLDMIALQKNDVLGDAYEYLIGQFAMESGKKAGEFYTPRQVSEILAQTVVQTENITSIYDPCVGSGSLLLTVKKHLGSDAQRNLEYYGQEKNTATFNLTRMNLLLHGVRPEKMTIKNGDTLSQDWPEDPENPDKGVQFDAIVMNPPYSLSKWNKAGLKVSDPRFESFRTLPPDSKGDYAFLLHGLYHLETNGTMSIVLPHGVLFRGSSEGEIRKKLIDKNRIDTVIGLPSNLFTNTGIPVCVLVLKKNRKNDDPILIIDASKNYIKVGKQNVLQEKDIAKIIDTYKSRKTIEGFSFAARREDIIKNDYNLNIPRYVESIDDDIPHDVDAHLYGGIPEKNISDLKVINVLAGDIIISSIESIRPGYVNLNTSIDDITNQVLSCTNVVSISEEIKENMQHYVDMYMQILKSIDQATDINALMKQMLDDVKQLLQEYEFIDDYNGYQVIADIWKNSLKHDSEVIANEGFCNAGRMRVPNMVTKGSGNKKREVQDGWNGLIISNSILKEVLFDNEVEKIANYRNSLQDIEGELSQLVEVSKEEDTLENSALYDALKKNEDDEPQDSFDSKDLKTSLKEFAKGTAEYNLLKKVEKLLDEKAALTKKIKDNDTQLKNIVEEKIVSLTDSEINDLMFRKWFGTTVEEMMNLITIPIKTELDALNMLKDRYENTLTDIDNEIGIRMSEFELLQNDLAVI